MAKAWIIQEFGLEDELEDYKVVSGLPDGPEASVSFGGPSLAVSDKNPETHGVITFDAGRGYVLRKTGSAPLLVNGTQTLDEIVLGKDDIIKLEKGSARLRILDGNGLQAEWKKLCDDSPELLGWRHGRDKPRYDSYSGWKLHISAGNEAAAYNALRVLRNSTFSNSEFDIGFKAISRISKVRSSGKDITVYIYHQNLPGFRELISKLQQSHPEAAKAAERFALRQIREYARKLADSIDAELMRFKVEGVSIKGDRPVPGTKSGRLFYRYDSDVPMLSSGKHSYVNGGASYNRKGNPDIFLKLKSPTSPASSA